MTLLPSCSRHTSISRLGVVLLLLAFAFSALPAQTYLGNFTSAAEQGKAITLTADTSSLRFVFYAPDIVRVDFMPSPATAFDSSFVVVQDTTANVPVTTLETDSTYTIASSAMTIVCSKQPLRARFLDASGRLLLSEPANGGIATAGSQRWATFSINRGDHFYGTGERGLNLDRRGTAFSSYNTQLGGYTTQLPTMNTNIPFLSSSNGATGYAIYFENTWSGYFDLGATNPNAFTYQAAGGELSYYFFAAETVPAQLERYTWLTGRQPLPPRWALGFIQSKYGYQNVTQADTMTLTMRRDHIPCDAIVLDLYWFKNMGDLAWNTTAFPNPTSMISGFLANGFKTIVITEPYTTAPSLTYGQGAADGYLGKDGGGGLYQIANWWSCGCTAGLVDMTNPAARTWWWSKHPAFLDAGVAGLWTDLGEPENHPLDMIHYLGSTLKVHNIYDLLWAQTVYNGFLSYRPNQRVFNLSRSGYAGIQRYGIIPWSGDVGKSFGGLAVQQAMMLGMGMSGLAYHNSDIGGFTNGTTTPELYDRWMQYGTFCPITRAHGTGQPTEPWGYGAQAESIAVKFIRLRYQLLPYIYTMAYKNYATGLPLARPLFFDHPGDPTLYTTSAAYMWGDDFLVSPVVASGVTSQSVYLPQGTWIDFWTDRVYFGPTTSTMDAPIDKMPILVKAGAIIPMQQPMDYSDQRPMDTLTVHVYPESDSATSFSMYEDDGKTLNYQSGNYAQTLFTQCVASTHDSSGSAQSIQFTIGATQGSFAGMISHRTYLVDFHGLLSPPASAQLNGRTLVNAASMSALTAAGTGYFYDTLSLQCYVQFASATDSAALLMVNDTRLATNGQKSSVRTTASVPLANGWNLVSVPVDSANSGWNVLFPTSSNTPFMYTGTGYAAAANLQTCVGYWVKVPAVSTAAITGVAYNSETITLNAGWNMIGTISSPVAVSSMTSDTPGLTISQVYGYDHGYRVVDSLYPGFGYWVRASIPGLVTINAGSGAASKTRVKIVPTSELPPPPPVVSATKDDLPKQFALSQNFPNPFNPTTTINYALPGNAKVRLVVYSVLGAVVRILADDYETAGYKSVKFDASGLSSGVYFIRFQADSYLAVEKIVLVK